VTNRFVLILGVLWMAAGSALSASAPLSPRNASYNIRATLDTGDKTIHGQEILTWRNISRVPAADLQFHLYMNAFKNNRSTLMRESGGRGGALTKESGWGWIAIDSMKIENGPDCASNFEFIRPDDANPDDQTVCRIRLPKPVPPGGTVRIAIGFTTRLPRLYMRTGFMDDFFMVAQWFPKIGVFADGKWNCHQFHRSTEFFADYGVYQVTVRLPAEYTVGAVGTLQKREKTDSTQSLTYLAEDVHDFSWTAWPHFKTARTTHRNVEILLLYDPDHGSSVPRYFDAMKRTLDFFAERIGPYPYPGVTIVDPPTGADGAGGMEYPTLITADTYWRMPRGIRFPEMVITHEFGHNYWYGMVGSNEFEEAWLDEGINSYTELRIMDAWFGRETSVFDLPILRVGELAFQRGAYISMVRSDRVVRDAWTYIGGGYGTLSYSKPALVLKTFENRIGVKVMDRVLKTYFDRWKFRHPRTRDFLAVVDEVAGPGYDRYFDQALNGSLELDYEVGSVTTGEVKEPKGIFGRDGMKTALPERIAENPGKKDTSRTDSARNRPSAPRPPAMFRSVIKIHRNGEMIVPVEILMVFEKGDTVRQVWDGEERWVKYEFTKPARLVFAEVDPSRKLVLDSDFTNNSKTVRSNGLPALSLTVRFLHWFQLLLHAAAFLA
jgi:hypothetical protein